MKLGTYSTIDCPTKKKEEAYAWLQAEFESIGGIVRQVMNPHDFGMYPSFEIDYPEELEDIDLDTEFDNEEDLEENQKLVEKKDKWIGKANDIETEYGEKFEAYL